jgi:hypothetical protein
LKPVAAGAQQSAKAASEYRASTRRRPASVWLPIQTANTGKPSWSAETTAVPALS